LISAAKVALFLTIALPGALRIVLHTCHPMTQAESSKTRQMPTRLKLSAKALADFAENSRCPVACAAFSAQRNLDELISGTRFAPPFGQSPAVFQRGKQFEAILAGAGTGKEAPSTVEAPTYAPLIGLIRQFDSDWPEDPALFMRSRLAGHWASRAEQTRTAFMAFVQDPTRRFAIDGAVFSKQIGGQARYFEADLLFFGFRRLPTDAPSIVIGEAKSFPVVSGQADPASIAAARSQMAIYALLARELVQRVGGETASVAEHGLLFTPKNVGLRPTATWLHMALEGERVSRIIRRAEELMRSPPAADVVARFDAVAAAAPANREEALERLVSSLSNRYISSCLSNCAFGRFCRHRARLSGEFESANRALARTVPGCTSLDHAARCVDGPDETGLDPFAETRVIFDRLQAFKGVLS
jgi:hypothetical protein